MPTEKQIESDGTCPKHDNYNASWSMKCPVCDYTIFSRNERGKEVFRCHIENCKAYKEEIIPSHIIDHTTCTCKTEQEKIQEYKQFIGDLGWNCRITSDTESNMRNVYFTRLGDVTFTYSFKGLGTGMELKHWKSAYAALEVLDD